MGMAASFEGPARAAILPGIVKPETFANAVVITSTMQSFAFVAGPALGGILIAVVGVGGSYTTFVALGIGSLITMALLRYRQAASTSGGVTVTAIKEGVTFVRANQVLLGAMALDMFAVIFGGVKALLPIYAEDILEVGPAGFGLLNASFEAGAFIMALLMVARRPVERTGRALIWAVVAFGVGTIVFGISRNFYLSLAVYTLIGASDMVSVVMRSTTIQLATPDELRGRVSAVNQVFIQSSNQVNTLYSGVVASLTTATFAVISGGFGTLATVGLIGWRLPKLYAYKVPRPVAVRVEEADEAEGTSASALTDEATANGDGTKAPSKAEEQASTNV
jgi:hypothetical protein